MQSIKTISILGCGWLGLPLAKALLAKGYDVKGSTTRAERIAEIQKEGVQPFLLKAENGNWVGEKLINFLTCDILIIAIPPGTKRNPLNAHALEIKALMQFMANASVTVKQLIYISSTSVYKNQNKIVFETNLQTEADAENKILFEAERHIEKSTTATDKVILRLGGLTGYDRMLARFFAGKTELAGGNEPVNLVHRDDVVGAIMFVIEKELQTTVLNICSHQHPTREAFYTQLCERFDLPKPHFSEVSAGWKKILSDKFTNLGYMWQFPDPYLYTYNQ